MKDYEVKYMELSNGEKLAYREAGQAGKVIVLIHGNMSSSVHYQPLMELLEKDYKIYAPDMVGFGDSTYKREINSLYDFSIDVREFIEKLDLKDIYLMGWSTGGGVCLELAAAIPERVKKVFLTSSVGIQGYPIFKKDENNKPILTEMLLDKEEIAKDRVQTVPCLNAYEKKDREFFKFLWNAAIYNNIKPSDEDYEKYIDAILKQRNIVDVYYSLATFNMSDDNLGKLEGTGRYKQVKAPVVLFHGENDLIVPLQNAKLTQKYFGDQAELVTFAGCGHSIFTDNLEKIYEEFTARIN